ncbi:hypothetical protein GCM10010168_20860 [Actinoplanes ianthinogenes]|uniref:Histidine kinase/HSP90-like ATPase domain-containing protein n=1 Tax=Actinoplanes ianthinogenes TaxID=122358 RepID=A0ABN6CRA9_9ACTN|nr:hypothetical protein Aiant_83840 [Actinoplanes ianthinogenes]GGR03754.1 hypothetical protein GCM10010168_20860 [Actinoplanes ianthinogenes]
MWEFVGAYGPDVTRLCRAGTGLIPGVTGIGLSAGTVEPGRSERTGPRTRFASDHISTRLESLQHTLDEGPCRDAASTDRPVLAADLTGGSWRRRWPRFTPAALDAGVRAVAALPLHAGAVRHDGALDLYRRTPGRRDLPDPVAAGAFAAAVTELLTLERLDLDFTGAFRDGCHPGSVADSATSALLSCWFDRSILRPTRGRLHALSVAHGLSGQDAHRLVTAVYEAMANVVEHGGGHGQLLMWLRDDRLWCEVSDHGPGIPDTVLPVRRPFTDPRTRHLDSSGLWLCQQFSTSVDIATDRTGTRMTMSFRLSHLPP